MNKKYEEKLRTLQGLDFCKCLEDYIKHNEEIEQENKQLKDNWNKLKEELKEMQYVPNITGEDYEEDYSITEILDKMQELEKGDSNVE